jgi:hypothetical protein
VGPATSNEDQIICCQMSGERTRERRALETGLRRSPGAILCALRLRLVVLFSFWFEVTAMDLRLLGIGAMVQLGEFQLDAEHRVESRVRLGCATITWAI